MKILLLHDYGAPTGGAELQMLALRSGLRACGHEVRLFSSRARLVPEGAPPKADHLCFGTTSPLQVLSQTVNPSAYAALRRVLRDFQPDVVHMRLFLWQLSPLVLPLLQDVPCLYQACMYKPICPKGTKLLPDGSPCRDPAGVACYQNGCLTPQSWVALMVQRGLWQRWRGAIDQIAVLSTAMQAKLEAEGIGPAEVVPNGVPKRPLRPPLSDPPLVAYAGRLVQEKGVDTLLHAFADIAQDRPAVRLLVAGEGAAEASLRALARRLGVAEQIEWAGHLPRAEMEERFEAAWVQAVPSLWEEPFGNVSTEAMMRGTAVVASAAGGQTDIVEDDQTGYLVPPGDAEALAAALRPLLRSRERAEQMGRAGRARALAHFSETRCLDRFLTLYRRILPPASA